MAASGAPDDELLARLVGIELAAAAVHDAVAATGLLDATAVALMTSFADHHRAHAAAYAERLGDGAATEPDPDASEVLFAPVFGAADATALLRGALVVEEAMVATAVDACGRSTDQDEAALMARVAAVEARHQAILGVALGADTDDTTLTGSATGRSLLDG